MVLKPGNASLGMHLLSSERNPMNSVQPTSPARSIHARLPEGLKEPELIPKVFAVRYTPTTAAASAAALQSGSGARVRRSRVRRQSSNCRRTAARSNAVPVALMNGEQLVALLAANEIGVTRNTHDIFDIEVGAEE